MFVNEPGEVILSATAFPREQDNAVALCGQHGLGHGMAHGRGDVIIEVFRD